MVDLGRVHGYKTALSCQTAIEPVGGPDDKLHDYIDGLLNVIRCKDKTRYKRLNRGQRNICTRL